MKPPKLILIGVAIVLAAGGAVEATRTKLHPASSGNTQHGLASQPIAGKAPDQSRISLAALAEQANDAPSQTPFSLMPAQSSPLAPDFQLTTLDGKTIKLSEAEKKGPVLLDFWATWCVPCQMEMPELGTVYSRYKAQGVQVYGINSDASLGRLKQFFQKDNPGYPMLADSSGVVNTIYNVSSIPALFLIDQNGRVRSALVGFDPNTQADLPPSIDRLLAEHPQKTL